VYLSTVFVPPVPEVKSSCLFLLTSHEQELLLLVVVIVVVVVVEVKVKVIPQQAEVAQGFPDRLRPLIFLTFGTTRVVGRQP
jgi:hypothetical protein